MNGQEQSTRYVRFDQDLCIGCASCLRICPTRAIRIRNKKSIRIVDQCIGCGHCVRVCPAGAVSAASVLPEKIGTDHIALAMVSPVLYAQFPTVMPKDVLLGLREMGFQHTIDMSYFLEIFQIAAEEFIKRNHFSSEAPWPLISPICPVVVRLIAFRFPNLLPNVLPVLRPSALMAREVKKRLIADYVAKGENVVLYYINPCPTKAQPARHPGGRQAAPVERALGINDIYPELRRQVERIRRSNNISFSQTRFEYETCATANAAMWGRSGGELADMDLDRCLAVPGLRET
ncbi:MAG: 4Fe-4S dicluster domain-containing protein, partial [Desulfobacterales bacterium]